ncbi:Mpm1p [Sugiyamaella lignohabitans]|uniref:Mpm1p n=1 Tax=Sugiyamaella lignohabitans TaxID=796027 RepID=A0A167C0V9_9ASCO|nr:Mpm1p [Sugiyamaella lignohabitans]ANB11079.1 Mpm1p [Sugiyamaella lignohabitans]
MTKDDDNRPGVNSEKDDTAKAWSELSGTLDEVWDLTDRTFGRLTNLASVYGDKVQGALDDNWRNWLDADMIWRSSWKNDGSEGGNGSDDGENNESWHRRFHRVRDCRKDSKMWGYPVPSQRQYDKCIENNGTSVWSRDGVWRCLFPESNANPMAIANAKDVAASASASSGSSLENHQWFTDYSVYLDWRRAMRKAEAAKRESEWNRIKERKEKLFSFPSDSDIESSARSTSISSGNSSGNNGSTAVSATSSAAKQITESEAEDQGKNVISKSIVVESVWRDGKLQTRQVVKKWYDDNTVSVKETTNSNANSNSNPALTSGTSEDGLNHHSNDSKGGWFWK